MPPAKDVRALMLKSCEYGEVILDCAGRMSYMQRDAIEGKSETFEAWEGFDMLLLACTWGSHMSRKGGPQSYNQEELNSANNLNEFGSRLSPRATRKECSPAL